jgi:hypothetical protein
MKRIVKRFLLQDKNKREISKQNDLSELRTNLETIMTEFNNLSKHNETGADAATTSQLHCAKNDNGLEILKEYKDFDANIAMFH